MAVSGENLLLVASWPKVGQEDESSFLFGEQAARKANERMAGSNFICGIIMARIMGCN